MGLNYIQYLLQPNAKNSMRDLKEMTRMKLCNFAYLTQGLGDDPFTKLIQHWTANVCPVYLETYYILHVYMISIVSLIEQHWIDLNGVLKLNYTWTILLVHFFRSDFKIRTNPLDPQNVSFGFKVYLKNTSLRNYFWNFKRCSRQRKLL